jgi:hypothetical protein
MTNLELLKLSSSHQNPLIDPYYSKGEIVLTPTSATKNNLMISNGRLIELITVFNYLDKEGHRQSDAEIAKVVDEIITILDTTEGINFSAFSQFFMVYNSAYSSYQTFSLDKETYFHLSNAQIVLQGTPQYVFEPWIYRFNPSSDG